MDAAVFCFGRILLLIFSLVLGGLTGLALDAHSFGSVFPHQIWAALLLTCICHSGAFILLGTISGHTKLWLAFFLSNSLLRIWPIILWFRFRYDLQDETNTEPELPRTMANLLLCETINGFLYMGLTILTWIYFWRRRYLPLLHLENHGGTFTYKAIHADPTTFLSNTP